MRVAPLVVIALFTAACTSSTEEASTMAPAGATTATSSGSTSAETTTSSSSTGSSSTNEATTGTSTADGGSSSSGSTGEFSYIVTLSTTLGDIVVQLDPNQAPVTVENFLAYVDAGFYDGDDGLGSTIFHRVVSGFVVQGGGLTETLASKATMPAIVNESSNGISNLRGRVAMARTNDPDSATSQFFINLVDNTFLDDPPGYTVFGEVIEGMDVVDAIGAVEVDANDVPTQEPVILEDVHRGMPRG